MSFETMNLTPRLKEMHEYWKECRWKKMRTIVFELKGASGTLSAEKLNYICSKQEQSCEKEKKPDIDRNYGEFLCEVKLVKIYK